MSIFKPKHATIIKHHRNSSVYIDGRYLHVDTKVSLKSKRGREVARETAQAILHAVGKDEQQFELMEINAEAAETGGAQIKQEGMPI